MRSIGLAIGTVALPAIAFFLAPAADGPFETVSNAAVLAVLGGVVLAVVLALVGGVLDGWRAVVSVLAVWSVLACVAAVVGEPSCGSNRVGSCLSAYASSWTEVAAPVMAVGGVLALVALVGTGLATVKRRRGWHPESSIEVAD